MERPQFKTLFCRHFKCQAADYKKQAFQRCLYPHARFLAPILRVIRPSLFNRDLGFIEYLGTVRHLSDAVEAASEFHDKGGFEKGFYFTALKIRVSGSKAIKLARDLFQQQNSLRREPLDQVGRCHSTKRSSAMPTGQ